MKNLILITLAMTVVGCSSGGGSGSSVVAESPSPSNPPAGTPVNIQTKSGRGFECFSLDRSVYCRGTSVNLDIDVNSVNFVEYWNDTNSTITHMNVWDDTICITSSVAARSSSQITTPGLATFCIGEASFQGTNDPRMKYDWTFFSNPSNIPSDIVTDKIPFSEFDDYMPEFLNGNFVTDGTSMTGQSSHSCEISADSTTLTCPTFSVAL